MGLAGSSSTALGCCENIREKISTKKNPFKNIAPGGWLSKALPCILQPSILHLAAACFLQPISCMLQTSTLLLHRLLQPSSLQRQDNRDTERRGERERERWSRASSIDNTLTSGVHTQGPNFYHSSHHGQWHSTHMMPHSNSYQRRKDLREQREQLEITNLTNCHALDPSKLEQIV